MTRFVLGVPVDGIGESLSHSQKPSLPENIFGSEMRDWISSMRDCSSPDYIRFGVWTSLYTSIRDRALSCIDILSEFVISDGMNKINKSQQGEIVNL